MALHTVKAIGCQTDCTAALQLIFQPAGSRAVANCLAWGPSPLAFGARGNIRDQGFSGLMDGVKIYDRALSLAQIQQSMGI